MPAEQDDLEADVLREVEDALAAAEVELGRPLDDDEWASVVEEVLAGLDDDEAPAP